MKQPKALPSQLDRRQFLKTTTGASLFIGISGMFPTFIACKDSKEVEEQLEKHALTHWVQLTEDGQITIFNPAAEMGQGSMTSLPAIFAEEMDAYWPNVRVEFSPQESAIYGSEGWGNTGKIMLSAGSRVTKGYYPIMRRAGAQSRYILMLNAADQWQVPMEMLKTEDGFVKHKEDNREISYGALVPSLKIPETLPEFTEAQFKDPSEYKLIGKDLPRKEIPQKVDGSAQFTMDIAMEDMVYAVLERGKQHGATPVLQNETSHYRSSWYP